MSNILVFRIGNLGDILVALPAFWLIRRLHPQDRIILLTDEGGNRTAKVPFSLLQGTGLFDEFMTYRKMTAFSLLQLLVRCRSRRFATVYYLPPSARSRSQIWRDRLFFRICGIRNLYGFHWQENPYPRRPDGTLEVVCREADYLLSLLEKDGFTVFPEERQCMELSITDGERHTVSGWVEREKIPGHRPWVAFAPGSNMPAKCWPLERFIDVGRQLIREYNIYPIIFGGGEDAEKGDALIKAFGIGSNAAGILSVRESAECIRRCAFYVGNDTGTMHLAAAVGTRCIAIFSSRENPGRWDPHGSGHIVLRRHIPCEGCLRTECFQEAAPCILKITVEEVLDASKKIIADLHS